MSFYHWQPPKEEDYSTEEEFLEAYEAWERAEDDYEEYMEMRREERNNQIFIEWKKSDFYQKRTLM